MTYSIGYKALDLALAPALRVALTYKGEVTSIDTRDPVRFGTYKGSRILVVNTVPYTYDSVDITQIETGIPKV